MKDITTISLDFDKFTKELIPNLSKAQQESARLIWEDVIATAPMDEGYFIDSIKVSDTEINNDEIKTSIGSDLMVNAKNGKSYNLGMLLETGTNPHAIPNAFGWGDKYGYNSEKYKETLDPNWHPGTRALNFYQNALNNNKTEYQNNLIKAIKESMK